MHDPEVERVNAELEWFEMLLDTIRDGKTQDATESILDAMRELRKYRDALVAEWPTEDSIDLSRLPLAAAVKYDRSTPETKAQKLQRLLAKYLAKEEILLGTSRKNDDSND